MAFRLQLLFQELVLYDDGRGRMVSKMALKKRKKENLYSIVERLRSTPKPSSKEKQSFNFNDPTALRALRIHRHLRALESEIVEDREKKEFSLRLDPSSQFIVLCIRIPEVHCSRVAYLTQQEFTFLRQNRRVANVLRRCSAWKDVA